MLTIGFFNDTVYTKDEELGDAVTFDFGGDGFKALINTGIFKLSHVMVDRREAIDLNQYRNEVRSMFENYPMHHPEMPAILSAVNRYRYFTADF